MKKSCNNLLYNKVKEKGFLPTHVAEVGVWHPGTSNIISYIDDGLRSTLVEPDPNSIKLIKKNFLKHNVNLHEVAICDFDGEVELCKRGSSTFVSSLPSSPALVNDSCNIFDSEKFIAKAIKFDKIDDGTIDLLSIDTEGSEWFVIKNMVSRPVVLSIETHGGMYTNPYIKEILEWLASNHYKLWFKNKSDSIYVHDDKISVTFFEKITLVFVNINIKFKSIKKNIIKKLQN